MENNFMMDCEEGGLVCLQEFLQVNTQDPDVDHISEEEAAMVKGLKPGESCFVGICKVTRLTTADEAIVNG